MHSNKAKPAVFPVPSDRFTLFTPNAQLMAFRLLRLYRHTDIKPTETADSLMLRAVESGLKQRLSLEDLLNEKSTTGRHPLCSYETPASDVDTQSCTAFCKRTLALAVHFDALVRTADTAWIANRITVTERSILIRQAEGRIYGTLRRIVRMTDRQLRQPSNTSSPETEDSN